MPAKKEWHSNPHAGHLDNDYHAQEVQKVIDTHRIHGIIRIRKRTKKRTGGAEHGSIDRI